MANPTINTVREELASLRRQLAELENNAPPAPLETEIAKKALDKLPKTRIPSFGMLHRTLHPFRRIPLSLLPFNRPVTTSDMGYDPLPAKEKAQQLPTPFRNKTMTNCHLNSWLSLVQTNPLFWDTYSTSLSKAIDTVDKEQTILSDATRLNNALFAHDRGSQRQQDVSETIQKFFERFESVSITTKRTEKVYRACEGKSNVVIEKELQSRGKSYRQEDNCFILMEEEMTLGCPILNIFPDKEKNKSLDQTVYEQWIAPQKADETATISDEKTSLLRLKEESTQLDKAPSALIFHAGRNTDTRNKNMGEIKTSERMHLPGKFFSSNVDQEYQLRGFIVHLSAQRTDGTYNARDGHYISYTKIKGEDGKTHYYRLDDATAIGEDNQEVFQKDPQKEISREEFLKAAKQFTVAVYNKL